MSFDITGKLIVKGEIEKKSEKFSVRDMVIEVVDGQYPQFVKFQLTNDRCSLLDSYNVGDEVKVHFDLRGREWQGKYFTNLNAWRLENGAGAPPPPANDTPVFNDESFPAAMDEPSSAPSSPEDLPF